MKWLGNFFAGLLAPLLSWVFCFFKRHAEDRANVERGRTEGRAEVHGEEYREDTARILASPNKDIRDINAAHEERRKRGMP